MNCLSFLSVALNSIIHRNNKKDSKVLLSFTFCVAKHTTFIRKYNVLYFKSFFPTTISQINQNWQNYFAFLYEIAIWLGAKSTDATVNNTDLLIIPLNKNNAEGITESANALKTLFFLKHIIQIAQ